MKKQMILAAFSLVAGVVFVFSGLSDPANAEEAEKGLQKVTLAGGCFWCMEPPFERLPGVTSVISGYTGGPEVNPSYREVASGRTGHTEAVQVTYDSRKISFEEILDV